MAGFSKKEPARAVNPVFKAARLEIIKLEVLAKLK